MSLTTLLVLFAFTLSGQSFDSLENNIVIAQREGNDSITMERMLDLLFEYYYSSVDRTDLFEDEMERCYEFAVVNNLDEARNTVLNLKGSQFVKLGQHKAAHQTYDELLQYLTTDDLKLTRSLVMDNKANVYLSAGQLDEALELKLEANKIIQEVGDSSYIATSFSGIGNIYVGKEQYHQGVKYFYKSLSYRKQSDELSSRAFDYGNLGIAYKKLNEPDSALYYFLKCRETSTKVKYLYDDNEAQLAGFYADQKNYNEAKSILKNLIDQFEVENEDPFLQNYRLLYAETCLQSKGFNLADSIFNEIDTSYLSDDMTNIVKYGKTGYLIKQELVQYEEALGYYKQFRDGQDSVNNIDRNIRFTQIESKYNVAEKEKVITRQEIKLKNRLLIIGGLLSFLLFGGALYANRIRKLRYQKQLSEQDRELKAKEIINLKQENKIISMQSMLEGQEEERKRIAQDLHDNIGSLMTTIKMKILNIQREVESIDKITITKELDSMVTNASQEVRRISHSMTPVAMDISGLLGAVEDLDYQLSSNGIEYIVNAIDLDQITDKQLSSNGIQYIVNAIDLDQITDKQLSINLFRIIQESINNTIKHAEATVVSVSAKIEDENLLLEIGDNGIGFDSVLWEQSETIGLSGIKSRVEYLNGSVQLRQNLGTQYLITIPINKV